MWLQAVVQQHYFVEHSNICIGKAFYSFKVNSQNNNPSSLTVDFATKNCTSLPKHVFFDLRWIITIFRSSYCFKTRWNWIRVIILWHSSSLAPYPSCCHPQKFRGTAIENDGFGVMRPKTTTFLSVEFVKLFNFGRFISWIYPSHPGCHLLSRILHFLGGKQHRNLHLPLAYWVEGRSNFRVASCLKGLAGWLQMALNGLQLPWCFGYPPDPSSNNNNNNNNNNHYHNDASTTPTFWISKKNQHHHHCTIHHHHPSKCQKPTCKYVRLKGAKRHFGLSNEPVVGQYQTGCNLNISTSQRWRSSVGNGWLQGLWG